MRVRTNRFVTNLLQKYYENVTNSIDFLQKI